MIARLLFVLWTAGGLAGAWAADEPPPADAAPATAPEGPSYEDPVLTEVADGRIPGVPPGPPPPAEDVESLAYDIATGLRCPVCQGLSVADSSASAAVAMKNRIRELVAAGYTEQQIEDFFVGRYGEWVLLEPTTGGLNLLLWIGPLAAGALGLGLALTYAAGVRDDEEGASPAVPASPPPSDAYASRILSEVDDD